VSNHSPFLAALLAAVSIAPVTAAQPPAPDAQALIAVGEAQLAEGKAAAAIVTLEQAVAADPKSSLAYLRLGGARLMRQENTAAIADFRNAVGADPNNADAFVGMAVAYLHSGDYALARAALGEAKRLAPAKGPEIDKVLSNLDAREGAAAPAGH
jgi:Tfp pilus assembly protein PilF